MEGHDSIPIIFLMTNSFETGGSERQFRVLVDSLREKEFQVELGCIGRGGDFRDGLGEVKHVPPGGNVYGIRSWRSRLELARYLRSHRVAIAHSFDFYSNLMLIPAARFARTPVVIGSHRQLGDLLSASRFRAQNAAFWLCDRVVSNSRAAAQRLTQHGIPARKVVVIPNGLPDEVFAQAAPALPREPGTLRVGMIARMNNPVKNYPGFLHAAARLAGRFPEVEWVLVGDGGFRSDLEKLARTLGLGRQARFLGNRRDIPAVLASLDISVLTSFSESLPNAILESMAAGLPVVATRVGGTSEVVREGETGFLVAPNDEIALANALERLMLDPALRRSFGERAREIARRDFSLADVRRKYEELYHHLLATAHRRLSATYTADQEPGGERPIRIGLVAPTLAFVGGQSIEADLLVKHWAKDSEVEARFIPIDPKLPGWIKWVEGIRYARTLVRMPFYWAGLWAGLRDVDIAHIFSASYWSFLLAPFPALVLAHLRRKKALINYHSGEARDHLSHWRSALPILRAADGRVVPSPYLARVFREFNLNVDIVPNIVDGNQFRYRRRYPLRPLLLCSRGFGAYYCVDLVVRAFGRVQQEFPGAHLCLLGQGEQEEQVRALVRDLGLRDVEFAGKIAREAVASYYDRADIFINASRLDNMPLSILEAFAAGVPVVSTAPDGIQYLVEHEHTGLLSEPGDWEMLARNVGRLLREPGLSVRLAEEAFQESRKYLWGSVREQWLSVYRQLLGNQAGIRSPQDPLKTEASLRATRP